MAFDAVAFVPLPVGGDEPIKVMHWNIAGGAKNWGEETVVDRIATRVHQQCVEVLSLNEICE